MALPISRQVLETVASAGQIWGLILILIGAALVFLSAAANRPLRQIQAAEIQKERSANQAAILALRERLAEVEYYFARAEKAVQISSPPPKDSESPRAGQTTPEPPQPESKRAQPKAEPPRTEAPKLAQPPPQRALSDGQIAILVRELKYFKGRKLQVNVLAGDPENDKFAQDLSNIMKEAGIDVEVTFGVTNVEAPPGLSIITGVRADEVQFAARVAQALISAGLASRPFSMVPAQNAEAPVALYVNEIRHSRR